MRLHRGGEVGVVVVVVGGGVTDTIRESTLRVDSGRKIPYRTGDSNLHPTLYQLRYVPAPWTAGYRLHIYLTSKSSQPRRSLMLE